MVSLGSDILVALFKMMLKLIQCHYSLLFWGAPKSLQMVTVAMKLKDAHSLDEKL